MYNLEKYDLRNMKRSLRYIYIYIYMYVCMSPKSGVDRYSKLVPHNPASR